MQAIQGRSRGCGAPLAALEAVVRGGPSQGDPLIRWLDRHPAAIRLPWEVRDDVIQSVGLILLSRGSGILARLRAANPGRLTGPAGDHSFSAYVGAMLRNRARDHHREPGMCQLRESTLVMVPAPEVHADLRAVLEALERARDRLIDEGSAIGSEAVRQLWALALGQVSLERLVAQLIEAEPTLTWARARDRLYKRHRRARQALVRELGALEAQGRLPADTAEQARTAVAQLFKQRR
ncbi:MAG TPA: hypothetical protein ENK18_11110 [Deltaproteobacteria bacterium]|nr:hypothetical protein [Deltaproteobacteria bacterium]